MTSQQQEHPNWFAASGVGQFMASRAGRWTRFIGGVVLIAGGPIVIGGIVPVRSGAVRLRGADVTHQAPELRRIGIVYQHAYLFPHLSVARNVGYGTDDRELARERVERFRLEELLDRDVKSLSGAVPQVAATCIPQEFGYPTLAIKVDRVKAARLGLSQKDVVTNVITALTSNQMIAPSSVTSPTT